VPNTKTMRRYLAVLLPLLTLLGFAAPAGAAYTAPAASTTYGGGTVPIDYDTLGPPDNDIRFEFTYTAGTNAALGNTWTVLLAGTSSSQAFTFPAANPLAASQVASVTPTAGATGISLPDGTYTVTYRYTDLFEGPISQSHVGVVLDNTTLAPTLTSPTASSVSSSPLAATYTLPEAALAGSIKLVFTSTTLTTRIVTLDGTGESAGAHSFTLNTSALSGSAGVAAVTGGADLPDGDWNVAVSYQDALSNTAASSTPQAFTLDTTTLTPTLTSPATGSEHETDIAVAYTLPEAALTGSVSLRLQSGSTDETFPLTGESAGSHTQTIARGALPDGTYTATLSYRDALGNTATTTANTSITLFTHVDPPVTPPPPAPDPTPTPTPPADPPQLDTPELLPPPPPAAKPAVLKPKWSIRKARGGRITFTATLKAVSRYKSYKLTAKNGKKKAAGTCRRTGGRVVCRLTTRKTGKWTLQLIARTSTGKTLATSTKTLTAKQRR
jgi:hypothetical protein